MNSAKQQSFTIIKALVYGCLLLSFAVMAESETLPSKDPTFLKRFPHSALVEFNQLSGQEYRLATGSVRKVNNQWQAEAEKRVSGDISRFTYRIPDGYSVDDVLNYFVEQLDTINAEYLYRCNGMACGSSHRWTNTILGIKRLNGPDKQQRYIAGTLLSNGKQYFFALYIIERGNRRVFSQIDIVTKSQSVLTNSDSGIIIRQLKGLEYVVLPKTLFNDDLEIKKTAKPLLDELSKLLNNRELRLIHVVGHYYGSTDIGKSRLDSQKMASAVKKELSQRGVVKQMSTEGLGFLAPEGGADRVVILLQSQ